jgi:hypothetical protein
MAGVYQKEVKKFANELIHTLSLSLSSFSKTNSLEHAKRTHFTLKGTLGFSLAEVAFRWTQINTDEMGNVSF